MAKYTTDYNLKKPDANEHYNVEDQNGNMDNIEAALIPTADPALIPSGLTGKIQEWISWIANRIIAITGKANWYETPATTLEVANTHINLAAPHLGHETIEGAQAKVNALAGIGNTKTVKQLADEAAEHMAETLYYTTQKLSIDANSIYTEVQHKRTDDTLILKSVLSGGISPQYTTRTETKYASDGTTVEWTKTYTLTYDSNDNVSSEVLI